MVSWPLSFISSLCLIPPNNSFSSHHSIKLTITIFFSKKGRANSNRFLWWLFLSNCVFLLLYIYWEYVNWYPNPLLTVRHIYFFDKKQISFSTISEFLFYFQKILLCNLRESLGLWLLPELQLFLSNNIRLLSHYMRKYISVISYNAHVHFGKLKLI